MSADAPSSQSVTPGKVDLNTKIENRASEFLHDTINARDLLDSGILCGATEEEILLAEESEKKNHSVNETSVAVPAPLAVVEMPQVVSGSQPVQKVKKYQCATCYKKFPDMSSLKRHVPTHKKDLHPYVCGRCQKRYKSEDELNIHMKTHVQEKPYRCSVCSREFSVAQILKRHMLIHSGERAHECEYCGKRFTTKADVTRHVRIHTGEKPHKCPYCESRFVQAGQLKRHLVTHEKYQEQLRDGTLPEKPARKKTKPHKCTICKAEFFHARQLQSHINFAHDNGGSDGASGSPQISPESRPVVGQNNLHSMEYASADALQGEGEWKTYAPDPGTTDAGLSTVVMGQPDFPEEPTPTIEWTDAPNPLTPQEMADLKPFIRISGHDDYAYSTPPPADKGNPAEEQQNVQQPVSASVAPQFVEANQLVQVDQSNVIGTTPDGKTVIMDFIPTVVGETVSTTPITQPYVAVEATTSSQDQTATKVNGDYIHVNDGTIMNVAPANGYYSANVVKSEVTEEVPGAQQGDLMELTAVKLGDIQNGVQPDGNVAANVENHAGYIPISQSQEKTGFKFEWEMPIDKHSMPEASTTCMPIPLADVNQCIPLPTADSGSIYLPVVPAESINKNYVPVTPEEINKQFGTMSMPAPISEPINYSTNQDTASVSQPQVQTVSDVQQPTVDPVTVPAPTPQQQQQSAQQPQQPQQQLTDPTPILAPDTTAQAALPPMPVPTLPQQVMPQQSLPVDATASEQAVQKDEQKPVSMLEELMLVLNDAPQNTEAEAPSPAVTETPSQGNEEFAGAHQCALCGKSFTNPVILKAHMLLHSGKKPHKCPVCGKKFGTEAYMKGHLLIHTGEAPHKCDYCGKVFSMKGDLNRHVRSHTGEKPHKCEICGKNFTQSGDKKRHMLLQHEGKLPFNCYICDMGFPTKIQFSQHKKTHKSSEAAAERPPRRQSRRLSGEHKKTDNQAAENSSGENSPYKCAQCYKSFSHPRLLIMHMRVHPAKNNNKCVDCGETFPSNDVLKTHIMENHEQNLPYQCSVCNKDFSEFDQLEAHRKIHTGEAPYKCGQCNKTFCHVDNLNKHVASHTTEKLYKCKLCDEHFTLRMYLNKHLKTCHTEQKLFMCLACDKEFAEIASLKRHIVTHKHDKAHKCKLCSKAFKSRSGLNIHMLSHKNKHECTICGKQFSLDIMLKNHMATHNDGDSSYACAEEGCDAVFVTQEQLSRHQHTTHDSQKPSVYDEDTEIETEEEEINQSESASSFTCAKCNATFSEFNHLKEHLEMHEEMEENCHPSKLDEGPSPDSAQDGNVGNSADTVPGINNTEASEGTSIPVGES